LFNGLPVPLLSAGPNKVSAIVPWTISGSGSVSIQIGYGGSVTQPFVETVSSAAPALFTMDGSGAGQCSCLNQDGSVNGPANPASRGDVVVLYGTGAGLTDPVPKDGSIAAGPYPTELPVTVNIGGEPAEILYAGAAPGMAGVIQVNAIVPDDAASNPITPIVLTVGEWNGQSTTTLAIR
jgi:uncharacterized protein (TIGR03437 family)